MTRPRFTALASGPVVAPGGDRLREPARPARPREQRDHVPAQRGRGHDVAGDDVAEAMHWARPPRRARSPACPRAARRDGATAPRRPRAPRVAPREAGARPDTSTAA